MKYFLDTDICIYFLKGKYPNVLKNIHKHHPYEIKIAAIVKAELLYGALKSRKVDENIEKITKFLLPFEIIVFNDRSTTYYAENRAKLEKKGNSIGPNDLIIASIVQSNDGILITNNKREFKRIKNLKLENWV